MQKPKTLEEVLASVSDVMYPAECGEAPVDVNSRGYDGDTPLHKVAWRGDAQGARLLIAAGADVNATGEMGETPLHIAVRDQNEGLVRLLIQSGARTDIESEFNETPLEKAQRLGPEVAEWLRTAANSEGK